MQNYGLVTSGVTTTSSDKSANKTPDTTTPSTMKPIEVVTLSNEVRRMGSKYGPDCDTVSPKDKEELTMWRDGQSRGGNTSNMLNACYADSILSTVPGKDPTEAHNALIRQVASCIVAMCHKSGLLAIPESIPKVLFTEAQVELRELQSDAQALQDVEDAVRRARTAEQQVIQLQAEKLALENQLLEMQVKIETLLKETAELKVRPALSDSKTQSVVVAPSTESAFLLAEINKLLEATVVKCLEERRRDYKEQHALVEKTAALFQGIMGHQGFCDATKQYPELKPIIAQAIMDCGT